MNEVEHPRNENHLSECKLERYFLCECTRMKNRPINHQLEAQPKHTVSTRIHFPCNPIIAKVANRNYALMDPGY